MLPTLVNDIYARTSGPDFSQLAQRVPALAAHLRPGQGGRQTMIDWNDDEAIRLLTSATLKVDFGLEVRLDAERLCPVVPGRLEYLVFILNLTLSMLHARLGDSAGDVAVTGLDIGTGSSCIYALLATTLLPASRLSMVVTECDARSLACARDNVAANNLNERIELVETKEDGPILPEHLFAESANEVRFTMCNPPFYASAEEIEQLEAEKEVAPFAVCTGARNEMITPGGEVAFVQRMIEQSAKFDIHSHTLFSSLLGKYSSLSPIIASLKEVKIDNYAIRVLDRGWTKRWVVVWTRSDMRLPDELSRGKESGGGLALLPPTNERVYECAVGIDCEEVERVLDEVWREAGVRVRVDEQSTQDKSHNNQQQTHTGEGNTWHVTAETNTWSRAARRARARSTASRTTSSPSMTAAVAIAPLLECIAHLSIKAQEQAAHTDNDAADYAAGMKRKRTAEEGDRVCVHGRWTRGLSRDAFASLWALVCRRLAEAGASAG